MLDKTYVVVTNSRWKRPHSYGIGFGQHRFEVQEYDYRKGGIGLIHPQIVDAYAHRGEIIERFHKDHTDEHGFSIPLRVAARILDEDGVPVLMVDDQYLTPDNRFGYFVSVLREEEFERICGQDINQASSEIAGVQRRLGIQVDDRKIEEQLKYLGLFDEFPREDYEIFSLDQEQRPDEEIIEIKRGHVRRLNEFEERKRRVRPHDPRFRNIPIN